MRHERKLVHKLEIINRCKLCDLVFRKEFIIITTAETKPSAEPVAGCRRNDREVDLSIIIDLVLRFNSSKFTVHQNIGIFRNEHIFARNDGNIHLFALNNGICDQP